MRHPPPLCRLRLEWAPGWLKHVHNFRIFTRLCDHFDCTRLFQSSRPLAVWNVEGLSHIKSDSIDEWQLPISLGLRAKLRFAQLRPLPGRYYMRGQAPLKSPWKLVIQLFSHFFATHNSFLNRITRIHISISRKRTMVSDNKWVTGLDGNNGEDAHKPTRPQHSINPQRMCRSLTTSTQRSIQKWNKWQFALHLLEYQLFLIQQHHQIHNENDCILLRRGQWLCPFLLLPSSQLFETKDCEGCKGLKVYCRIIEPRDAQRIWDEPRHPNFFSPRPSPETLTGCFGEEAIFHRISTDIPFRCAQLPCSEVKCSAAPKANHRPPQAMFWMADGVGKDMDIHGFHSDTFQNISKRDVFEIVRNI